MDLDKIKEAWSNADLSLYITEDKILRMLNNEGKSALAKLLFYEKLSLIILPFFIFTPFLHNYFFPEVRYSLLAIIWLIGGCLAGMLWQLHKIKLLKKINPLNVDILTSLKYTTRYRQYIQYEIFAAISWLIVFLILFYIPLFDRVPSSFMVYFLILAISTVFIALGIVVILYKIIYARNIKRIEKAILEIRDFEKNGG